MAKKKADAKKTHLTEHGFETPEELEAACDEYFEKCDADGSLYGQAGIALHLGVTTRTIDNWFNGNTHPEFRYVIERAFLRIQNQYETDPRYMQSGGANTKAIFALKQKKLGGYVDRVESNTDVNVKVNFGKNVDESDFQ